MICRLEKARWLAGHAGRAYRHEKEDIMAGTAAANPTLPLVFARGFIH